MELLQLGELPTLFNELIDSLELWWRGQTTGSFFGKSEQVDVIP